MSRRTAMQCMRVQAALLTGAGNLTADLISLVAHVPRYRVELMLKELGDEHMLTWTVDNSYKLTPHGREHAISRTGLDLPE